MNGPQADRPLAPEGLTQIITMHLPAEDNLWIAQGILPGVGLITATGQSRIKALEALAATANRQRS